MRQLDFREKKVEVLTLQELEHTYHENLIDGTPVGGVYHFVLIQQLLEIFQRQGLHPEVQEVFAADNRDSKRPGVTLLPAIEAQEGERALAAHVLRRVYANVAIRDDERDEVVTNLAVAYHQRGIQVGIGPMVKVCHNQTIMFAADVVSNYQCWGGDRMKSEERTLETIYEKAREWAAGYDEHQQQRQLTEQMLRNQPFGREDLYRTVGVLVEKRIVHDTAEKSLRQQGNYPLNSSQINEAVEALLTDVKGRLDDGSYTYWDCYQQLNRVLKPDRMDIPQVLPQHVALMETLNHLALGEYE